MQNVLNWLALPHGNYVIGLNLLKQYCPNAPEIAALGKMDSKKNREIIKGYLFKLIPPKAPQKLVQIGAPSTKIITAKQITASPSERQPTTLHPQKQTNQREWGEQGRKLLDAKARAVNARNKLCNQNVDDDGMDQSQRAELYAQIKKQFEAMIDISHQLDSYQTHGMVEQPKPTEKLAPNQMSDEALINAYRSAKSQISKATKTRNEKAQSKWRATHANIIAEMQKRGIKTSNLWA